MDPSEDEVTIIFCLALKNHPVQPDDISMARPVPCPDCTQSMWLSIIKEKKMNSILQTGKQIIFCCEDCVKERFQNENFEFNLPIQH